MSAADGEDWWRGQLARVSEPCGLLESLGRVRRAEPGSHRLRVRLEDGLSDRLRQAARDRQVTLNTLMQGAWALALARHGGRRQVVFGVTVSGRPAELPGVERMLGLFINSLPLWIDVPAEVPVSTWLRDLQRHNVELRQYEHTPLSRLQQWAGRSGDALFDSLLVFENYPVDAALGNDPEGLRVVGVETLDRTHYPLTLTVLPRSGLVVDWEWDGERVDRSSVERLSGHYVEVLEHLASGADLRVGELSLSCDAIAGPVAEYGFRPAAARIAKRAALQPGAEAIACEGVGLSYGELEAWSNRIGRRLQRLGVAGDERVGLCVERSVGLPAALLGVLKSGAAFVPLDPAYPEARLAEMIADAGVRRVVADRDSAEGLAELLAGCELIVVEDVAGEDDGAFCAPVHPDQLAYVIYTSGSTGRPKGVAISHGALSLHLDDFLGTYGIGAADTVLQSSTINFDVALHELLPALCMGGRVVMRGAQLWDLERLSGVLAAEAVTFSRIPTAYWQQWLRDLPPDLPSLRQVTVGGEGLPGDALARWQAGPLRHVRLDNLYGPTETAIAALYRETIAEDAGEVIVPIGRPYPGRRAAVLDGDGNMAPVGGLGELCIGGRSLARGYLNRPGLTAERFVPDPFGASGSRLYRSGDLCRQRADGTVEFLGRLDEQIKLRGYRIELGEVEAALRGCAGVRDAAAAVKGAGEARRLVGYVTGPADAAEMRAALSRRLPEHMVPASIVVLDALPLMPNGKVDRNVLPEPEFVANSYVAPRTPIEATLCRIWEEVLGIPQIGITDNFFERGGHSLLAMQVVSRIRQALDREVALRLVFERPVLADLAATLAGQDEAAGSTIMPRPVGQNRLPLSYGQERLWFLWKLEPDSAAYNSVGAIRLTGELDAAACRQALHSLVFRHEALRTRFEERDGITVQVIGDTAAPDWSEIDLGAIPAVEREDYLAAHLRAFASQSFDLVSGPLVRAELVRVDDREHVLALALHHIVSDGWSVEILLRELAAFYSASVLSVDAALPALPIQYGDYALWQREQLTEAALSEHLAYWRGRLGEEHPMLELPADRVRSGPRSTAGEHVALSVPASVTEGLRRLSRSRDATLFMTLLAAFDVLLHRYSGQGDIRIGVPVAGRSRVETEGLIGFFVNTLVIRAEVSGSLRFDALLAQVRERVLEAQAHQDLPFGQLVAALQPDRSLSHTPLFQVLFNMQPAENDGPLAFSELTATVEAIEIEAAQFDLTVDAAETPAGLDLMLRYATDLFDASTIERLAGHYVELLEQLAEGAVDVRLSELRLTVPALEAPSVSYPFVSVLERIALQVAAHGTTEAVSYENDRLSYGDLAVWSNRIGRRLKRLGIGCEARVGLCVERSVGLVAGVLGILKAGGAYVPLDPAYPVERLMDMIADSGIRVVVADRTCAVQLADLLAELEVVIVSDVDNENASDWIEPVHPEQLAYVIYTSGSTGRPKGVGVTHRNLARLLDATAPWYRFGAEDVWTLFHSYAFDFSVWELFGALAHGGRLVVVPHWTARDAEAFHALLGAERVTVLNQTPSAFLPLMQVDLAAPQPVETLRVVIFGGEKLEPASLRRWLEERGVAAPAVINMYGITETTVHVSYRPLELMDMVAGKRSVIGVPISDLSLRVLDGGMNPVPQGGIGEIHVGGAGLARGYLNRPGLTAERFVPDPSVPGGRLYTSGDLARRLVDDDIAYLGRNDQQVKIRGYRIELGEIEAALMTHPAVREAAVIATGHDTDGYRLIAYVVGDETHAMQEMLRDHLADHLPAHMAPAAFVVLDALPLTVNGKLDQSALPEPEFVAATYVAPRTPIEATLCRIWEEVLGIHQIGITDNFFERGGDSIRSLQIIARARQAGLHLTPKQIFEHPTIAAAAEAAIIVEAATLHHAEISGPLVVTPIQSWFFERNPSGPSHWNQSVLLRVLGGLDPTALECSLQALVARHDALRLRFERAADGAWQQRVAPVQSGRLLEVIPLDGPWGVQHATAATRLQRSLNLQDGPLLRAGYFPLGEDEGRLLLAVHHLAVDGVSWRVLLDELQQAYAQAERGEGMELPAASTPWSQWAMLQAAYAQRPEVRGEFGWWQALLSGVSGDLPVEGEGDRSLGASRELRWQLDRAATRRLLDAAPRAYRMGVDEVLLSALAQVLGEWTGRDAVLVELEGHGREDVLETADLTRTVGWFTTRYPVVLPCQADASSSLKAVKERLRSVPAKGLRWGLLEYGSDADIRAAIRALPRAQVSFNYLGQFDQVLDANGRFAFAPETGGEAVTAEGTMTHLLSLNGLIANGELSLRWRYSPGVFAEATIDHLIAAFEGRLSHLIHHAATAERAPTPSDFNIPMDQGEFDDLLADIEGDAHGR